MSGGIVRRVVIFGRVQGVGFRAFVEDEAQALGLAGWARNRRDGSVEAVFAGPAETVAAMVAICRQGPRLARVDHIDEFAATSADLGMRYSGEAFSLLPTA